MRRALLFLPGLCVLAGCMSQEGSQGLALVSGNPFGTPPPAPGMTRLAPANSDAAMKVDCVGRKLIAANAQTGLKPYFLTLGSPTLEVFHVDTKAIYVTEGVVSRCKTEEDLAAVLACELGKMVAARENLANDDFRRQRPLPIQVAMGNDGQGGGADRTAVAELARYEKDNPRPTIPAGRPNPLKLASGYLEKAGYPRVSLEKTRPMLEEAESNCALERMHRGLPPKDGWAR